MVVHKAPFTREELIAGAKAFPGCAPGNPQWTCSYCGFTGKTHLCEWEGSNEKVLRGILELTEPSFDRVRLVQQLDVLSGELEG